MIAHNPDWTEEEHILALDLYLSCKPSQPQKGSPEVDALSGLLTRLHQKSGTQGASTLRNPGSVYMKLMNLKAHDPDYISRGVKGLAHGSKLEAQVWKDYGADPVWLRQVAQTIRSFVASDVPLVAADLGDDTELAPEGQLFTRIHRTYERKPQNRKKKLAAFRRENGGRIFCECCGFDFEQTYGAHGSGFIEVHHETPVSSLRPGQSVKLGDFRLLCANCHRMVHRQQPWLTPAQLSAVRLTTM